MFEPDPALQKSKSAGVLAFGLRCQASAEIEIWLSGGSVTQRSVARLGP
jgi:hypothetical protein